MSTIFVFYFPDDLHFVSIDVSEMNKFDKSWNIRSADLRK